MLQIGDTDAAWLDWFNREHAGIYGGLCRTMVVAPPEDGGYFTCTLLPGHNGPHICHYEDSGIICAMEDPPIPPELRVSEGL